MYCPFAAAIGDVGSLTFAGGYCRASSAKTTGSVARSQTISETHLFVSRGNNDRNLRLGRNRNIHTDFRYYSGVRRTALGIGLLTALVGCYSGTRPPRIGQNAPDFTVQDSDRKVTLN